MKRFFLTVVLAACWIAAGAQSIPIDPKFGAVSEAELELSDYQQDTSASVLVLYRHRDVHITMNGQGEFYRKETFHERIKVLKEAGKSYPDYKLYYREPKEFLTEIKVSTYNLDGNKKSVDKLSKKMVFDEVVSGKVHCVSFSAPGVRVGSVVEVSYCYETPRIAEFGTVSLQDDVPINLCEATVAYIPCFIYNIHKRGSLACINYRETDRYRIYSGSGGTFEVNRILDHYRAYNIPALKSAPHCYCPSFYRLAYDYDLRSYDFDGVGHKDFSTSWENVDDQIVNAGILKEFHSKPRIPVPPTEGLDEEEAIRIMRDAVVSKVKWNGKRNIFPECAKAVKAEEGDAADIAALLAGLLEASGYETDPVFLMTRDQGHLLDHQVKADAYNAVVLRVKCPSGKTVIVDPAPARTYINALSPRCLVDRARVIPKVGFGSWMSLENLTRNQYVRSDSLRVQADGTILGGTTATAFNCKAGEMKATLDSYGSEEKLISEQESLCGIEIDSLDTAGMKDWSPKAEMTYSWRGSAQKSPERMYIKPFVEKLHSGSTFRDAERMVPVDLPFPESINYGSTVIIPEGWTVESLPKSVYYEDKNAKCYGALQAVWDGERTITVLARVSFSQILIPVEEYSEFRKFWERLCSIYDTTIVLKKI